MYCKIIFIYTILAGTICYLEATKKTKYESDSGKNLNWTFKDYLAKYNPRSVWEKIDKMKKKGVKLTVQQEIDLFFKGIDMTDDFLRLKVENGDPKLLVLKDGRRWRPPVGLAKYSRDKFDLRRRLYELMKQAIYQARNKMVIMQIMRDKYRDTSLYKMGFLISKTDSTCKTFSQVTYRAFRACVLARQSVVWRHRVYDILASEERILNLWFTIDLLVGLIRKNDLNLKTLFATDFDNLKEQWKFVNK